MGDRGTRGRVSAAACAAAVALCASCDSVETVPSVTVYVLTSSDQDVTARATEYSITVFATSPVTFDVPIPDSAAPGTAEKFTFRMPPQTTTATVEVIARDAGGLIHGFGRSVPILIAPGHPEEVAVLVLRRGAFARGPSQMTLAEKRSLHSALTVFEQWMMVAGGTAVDVVDSMEMFDLRILKPSLSIPSMPAARSRAAAIPVTPAQIVFLGGVLDTAQADVFDASTARFTSLALPAGVPTTWIAPRHVVLDDGSALVMSGFDAAGDPVGTMARVTAGDVALLDAATSRADPTVTPVETPDGVRVLVYGGNAPGEASAVLLDPATWAERPAGSAPDEVRSRHTAVRYGPSRVMIAGGVDAVGAPATFVWLFDAACLDPDAGCDAWSTIGPALDPAPFMDADGVAIEAAEDDPRVVFACGVDAADNPLAEAAVLDASRGVRSGRPLVVPRSACRILRLQSGQIAIVGGRDASGEPLGTMEFFEPEPL